MDVSEKIRRKALAGGVFDRRWSLDGVKTLIKKYQCEIFHFVDLCSRQWHNNCPADSATQGGPRGSGALVPTPPPIFSRHSCRLCIVVLMDAAQFTSNCSIAGTGALWPCFAAFAGGGGRICSYATGSGVGIVWSTTTRTRVSDATAVTFSVKCFNPLKLNRLSENIFRQRFALYFFY